MKASFTTLNDSNKIAAHRKEKGFYKETSILDPRDGSAVVIARWYWPGRDGASNCYCCIWIYGDTVHGRGAGKAGGYGYHKESAALAYALDDAGIALTEDIGGRGDSATRDALEAVARAVTGRRKFFRHESHA
jgi:hypothetical protein